MNGAIPWLFLVVSALSLAIQLVGLSRMTRPPSTARSASEVMVRHGMIRTVACRVLAAGVYVALGIASLTMAQSALLGLAVFAATQLVWISNSVADLALRRRLDTEPTPHTRKRGTSWLNHRDAPVRRLR